MPTSGIMILVEFSGHSGLRQKPQLRQESQRQDKPGTSSSATSLPPDKTYNSSNTRPPPRSRPVTPPASQHKGAATANGSAAQQLQDHSHPDTAESRQLSRTPPEARVCVAGSRHSLQSLAPQPSTSVSQKPSAGHRGPPDPFLHKPPAEYSGWEPGYDTARNAGEEAGAGNARVGQGNHQGVNEPGFNGRGQEKARSTPWPRKARGGNQKEEQGGHVSQQDWEHPAHEGNRGGLGQGRGERSEPHPPVTMNIDVVGRMRPQSRGEGLSSLLVEASGRVAAQAGGPYFG